MSERIKDQDNRWRFCVAPMLDWTDSHCRVFHRALSKGARLYTEMVTAPALVYGPRERLLRYDAAEHPVACQLGGSDVEQLSQAARMVRDAGYDEINFNCGCPSERVQRGNFGASLMLEPKLVADCYKAMADASGLPVTIKHRIGVDDEESYAFVSDFVGTLYETGCRTFIVHVRKAYLQGLSPKENREIPPLKPEVAYQLKADFPQARFIINGGIKDLAQAEKYLEQLDGVMVGREAYVNPWLLSDVDARLFASQAPAVTRESVIEAMIRYIEAHFEEDPRCARGVARHMLGLLNGLAGAKAWRRMLTDPKAYTAFGPKVLMEAYARAGWKETSLDDTRFDDDEF